MKKPPYPDHERGTSRCGRPDPDYGARRGNFLLVDPIWGECRRRELDAYHAWRDTDAAMRPEDV